MTVPPLLVAMSSGDLMADRRFERARDCEICGDFAGAIDLLRQTLELAPAYGAAWFTLGGVLEKSGDREAAAAAYVAACNADPSDRLGAGLCLMRLQASAFGEMPADYVRSLFDQYAGHFEDSLVDRLHYRGPALLREAVETALHEQGRIGRFGSVLDLGCGTGLAGEAFRPFADWLVGVDISGAMIARAKKKIVYDRLHHCDFREFVAREIDAAGQYHLVVAADVFAYVADLAPVLAGIARILTPDGLVAFTAETTDEDGVSLRNTRFAHNEDYVRSIVASAELAIVSLSRESCRSEKGEPVPSLVVVAGQGSCKTR